MDQGQIRMSYYETNSGELIVERGFSSVAAAKAEAERRVRLGKVDLTGFGVLIDEDDLPVLGQFIEGSRA